MLDGGPRNGAPANGPGGTIEARGTPVAWIHGVDHVRVREPLIERRFADQPVAGLGLVAHDGAQPRCRSRITDHQQSPKVTTRSSLTTQSAPPPPVSGQQTADTERHSDDQVTAEEVRPADRGNDPDDRQ